MLGRASIVSDDAETPYLTDAALYHALPTYVDLVDAAVSAEMDWLHAKSQGESVVSKRLLEAYTSSLAPRRCRLFGTLLACSRLPGGDRAREADLYVKIRLHAPSITYRDRIYECHYPASPSIEGAPATIRELGEGKIGEDVRLVGWLERSFCVPGFYLARARRYRGPASI